MAMPGRLRRRRCDAGARGGSSQRPSMLTHKPLAGGAAEELRRRPGTRWVTEGAERYAALPSSAVSGSGRVQGFALKGSERPLDQRDRERVVVAGARGILGLP